MHAHRWSVGRLDVDGREERGENQWASMMPDYKLFVWRCCSAELPISTSSFVWILNWNWAGHRSAIAQGLQFQWEQREYESTLQTPIGGVIVFGNNYL